jgi:hypothetical protein
MIFVLKHRSTGERGGLTRRIFFPSNPKQFSEEKKKKEDEGTF